MAWWSVDGVWMEYGWSIDGAWMEYGWSMDGGDAGKYEAGDDGPVLKRNFKKQGMVTVLVRIL